MIGSAKSNASPPLQAFSEEQVERLTGISRAQLRYWDRTGFFVPAHADQNRRVAFSRIYSFRDVVALRVLNILRNQHNVPLQHLRKVGAKLAHLDDEKWIRTTLWIQRRRVVFQEPGSSRPPQTVNGQFVLDLPLKQVVTATREDVQALLARSSDALGRITRSRSVSHNAPVVAGTRVPIRAIRHFFEDGYSVGQILAEYPGLTDSDVQAALKHPGDAEAA